MSQYHPVGADTRERIQGNAQKATQGNGGIAK
jgi:hypothetical protein